MSSLLFFSKLCLGTLAIALACGVGPVRASAPLQLPRPSPARSTRETRNLPPPVITGIQPGSVPPGGKGEIVFTGKSLTPELRPNIYCGTVTLVFKRFKVTSPERAVGLVSVPFGTREGRCSVSFVRYAEEVGKQIDIETSPQGTWEVFQVPAGGPTLTVAKSGNPPAGWALLLPTMYMLSRTFENPKSFDLGNAKYAQGELEVTPESFKYSEGGKAVFSEPNSSVVECQPVSVAFQVFLKGGKGYTFYSTAMSPDQACQWFKQIAKLAGGVSFSTEALLLGEGRPTIEQLEDLKQKKGGTSGMLRTWTGSLQYLENGKVLISEPGASVTSVERLIDIDLDGNKVPSDFFRVALKNGKSYNFYGRGDKDVALKKALGI